GVAKAMRKLQRTITGEIRGKLGYMAPEQLHGLAVTRQADIYAAGVMLWELLTGERLFEADTEIEALLQRLREQTDPVPPSECVPEVTSVLEAVVGRALSREARHRFATAEEMALALKDHCPPAPPEDVAQYVQRMGVAELERLAALVKEVEAFEEGKEGEARL